MPAAIGFSSHSGWAAVVCLGGPAPVIIERSRVMLTSAPLPREPYHDARGGAPVEAEKIVTAAAEEARALAVEAITGLLTLTTSQGDALIAGGVVLGAGRTGLTLAQALSTHAAMHGAEGWLFREALIAATQQCGLEAMVVAQRGLRARSAAALGTSERSVSAIVQQLGQGLGAPWGQDQKTATMAALLALRSASERLPAPT